MENNNEEIFKQFITEELIQQLNEASRQAVNESAIEINKERLVQQAIERQKQILAALESGLTTDLPPSETKRSLVDLKESKVQWVKDLF
ncbi:hypothetical protein QNH16_06620 [Peribacillus frigoritolerans]|uniref:hypothetical protein n=1 Tax=Peribacillus frigoritolerans TaxID=450367 RepID=UPI0024BFF693|nr:hypothetical protein [Peribacillus frigoritolerans]WHY15326.1 hypothetical protein QNH16_06620 [Peribacillus frigoritolerans]